MWEGKWENNEDREEQMNHENKEKKESDRRSLRNRCVMMKLSALNPCSSKGGFLAQLNMPCTSRRHGFFVSPE